MRCLIRHLRPLSCYCGSYDIRWYSADQEFLFFRPGRENVHGLHLSVVFLYKDLDYNFVFYNQFTACETDIHREKATRKISTSQNGKCDLWSY